MDNNQISDIKHLENLTKMIYLSLTNNKIVKLIDFSGMKDLMILKLGNNPLGEGEWENIKLPKNLPFEGEDWKERKL